MNLSKLFYYDELSPVAKEQAKINVMVPEVEAKACNIEKAYWQYRANPNKAINDAMHIKRLTNGAKAFYKVRAMGDNYLIPFIQQNKTIFTECGAYVYYLVDFGVVSGGKRVILDAEQQKEIRQPYLDVNDRGPAYHRELYNRMRKASK